MSIVICAMTKADIETVAFIERQNFSNPWKEKDFENSFLFSNYHYIVAKEEDAVVGFAGISCSFEDCDLIQIAVEDQKKGQGIGKDLLLHCFALSKEQGAMVMHLEVRESNEVARNMYQNYGFIEVGVRKQYYRDPVEDGILMNCDLTKRM